LKDIGDRDQAPEKPVPCSLALLYAQMAFVFIQRCALINRKSSLTTVSSYRGVPQADLAEAGMSHLAPRYDARS